LSIYSSATYSASQAFNFRIALKYLTGDAGFRVQAAASGLIQGSVFRLSFSRLPGITDEMMKDAPGLALAKRELGERG